MNNNDELRQSLLELHYDLLDADEAARLRTAIETDPEVAQQWAQTLRMAGQLAAAAKIGGAALPEIDMRSLLAAEPSQNGRSAMDSGAEMESISRSGNARWWLRSGTLAATAAGIGFLVIGSWYVDRVPSAPSAALQLEAQAVSGDEAESDNEYRFVTHRIDASSSAGRLPVTPASLSFSVLARGVVLFSGTTQTGRDGTGRVTLPPELTIPTGAQLRVTASSTDGQLSESMLEVPLEPTRCLTYLTVDRPVYRPGETVFFRSLTLQRRSFRAGVDVPIRFELIDPSGAVVPGAFVEGVSDRGVGNGSFQLPTTAPGGLYTIVAHSLDGFFPEERREFHVRAYRVPRFKKELDFRRRSYGPGETVAADFSALRAEGGSVVGAAILVTATVDEKIVHQQAMTTSASGGCAISFTLPEHIRVGVGNLSVTIDDGGTQETQTKTIPIQLGRVAVDFYPEGGYLVEGLTNRVYFAARDTLGDPIHIVGEIQSRSGQSVATIETTRDGMGRFEFVPQRGERYSLKVTAPVDVTNSPRLPAAVNDLPVIDTGSGVFDQGRPISIVIRSKSKRQIIVRAVCRGRLVGEKKVVLRPGEQTVLLPVRKATSGVVRITLLDDQQNHAYPLVERLVFCRQEKRLHVEIVESDSALHRSPGEPLRLTLQVRDEQGNPAPAVLGVSVVDDAALSLDETERPTLRTHFLLTSEVQKPEDLEHANFYLSDDPQAGRSLDLLLGTQGWRRFVTGSPGQSNVDFREQLIRLLELDGKPASSPSASFSNAGLFDRQWDQYRAAIGIAWNRLLFEARLLMMAVLVLWLAAIVIRMRRHSRSLLTSWLLIAVTSLFLYGCGGAIDTMVQPGAQVSENTHVSASEEQSDADESMTGPAAFEKSDEMEALDDAPEGNSAADPESDQVGRSEDGLPKDGSAQVAAGLGTVDGENDDAARSPGDVGETSMGGESSRAISKDDLQRLLAARGLDAEALADQLLDELRFPIRQYAHQHRKNASGVRHDFAETLYWQPMLVTDSTGKATIRFDLSDSVTTFRVNVDGHSADGRLGSGGGEVTARLPFQIEPKLPLEVTTGDRIDLPIAVINATDNDLGVELTLSTDASIKPVGDTTRTLTLRGNGRQREQLSLLVVEGSAETDSMIEIRGVADGSLGDTVRRSIHVSPAGYPRRESIAGVLNERATIRLPIPRDIVDGSLAVTVRAFPSPLADVMSGIESILQEPHGCFEQTSATNYPNTMALLYLEENKISNPEVSRRARGLLDRGYAKLTSFECQRRGYEWFGSDPGHEALSAFGLMQFADMTRVMSVSESMVARTRKWLMGRRDGAGGFKRNPRHLHVWSVQQPIVNAYVLWAITEADVAAGHAHRAATELAPELDKLNSLARQSDDPYLIALSAAALLNVRRTASGEELLEKLATLQAEDGGLQGKTTVTSSGGISLRMETTALATLAWVKSPRFLPQARAAARWITSNRQGGSGFGSTQATVLALKALVAISSHSQSQSGGGELQVMFRGEMIGQATLPVESRSGSTVEIPQLGTHLQDVEGEVQIELVALRSQQLSYTVDISYHALTPKSHQDCPLELTTELSGDFSADSVAAAGNTFTVKTRLVNVTDAGQPMTIAIIGLPGGVEPRVEELDDLQDAGKFDYYELRGREVIFYWRTIEPRGVKEIDFTVTAAIPGKYTGPASRAYLYYTAEQKCWIQPLVIDIRQ